MLACVSIYTLRLCLLHAPATPLEASGSRGTLWRRCAGSRTLKPCALSASGHEHVLKREQLYNACVMGLCIMLFTLLNVGLSMVGKCQWCFSSLPIPQWCPIGRPEPNILCFWSDHWESRHADLLQPHVRLACRQFVGCSIHGASDSTHLLPVCIYMHYCIVLVSVGLSCCSGTVVLHAGKSCGPILSNVVMLLHE